MRLNDTVIPHAKPGPKPFKLFDGGGLHLLVNANGSRWSSRKPADSGARSRLSALHDGQYEHIG